MCLDIPISHLGLEKGKYTREVEIALIKEGSFLSLTPYLRLWEGAKSQTSPYHPEASPHQSGLDRALWSGWRWPWVEISLKLPSVPIWGKHEVESQQTCVGVFSTSGRWNDPVADAGWAFSSGQQDETKLEKRGMNNSPQGHFPGQRMFSIGGQEHAGWIGGLAGWREKQILDRELSPINLEKGDP